jgi:hypothetical protein
MIDRQPCIAPVPPDEELRLADGTHMLNAYFMQASTVGGFCWKTSRRRICLPHRRSSHVDCSHIAKLPGC